GWPPRRTPRRSSTTTTSTSPTARPRRKSFLTDPSNKEVELTVLTLSSEGAARIVEVRQPPLPAPSRTYTCGQRTDYPPASPILRLPHRWRRPPGPHGHRVHPHPGYPDPR